MSKNDETMPYKLITFGVPQSLYSVIEMEGVVRNLSPQAYLQKAVGFYQKIHTKLIEDTLVLIYIGGTESEFVVVDDSTVSLIKSEESSIDLTPRKLKIPITSEAYDELVLEARVWDVGLPEYFVLSLEFAASAMALESLGASFGHRDSSTQGITPLRFE